MVEFEGTPGELAAQQVKTQRMLRPAPPNERLNAVEQVILDVMSTSKSMPGSTARAVVDRLVEKGLL
jgi:hypothetical protein